MMIPDSGRRKVEAMLFNEGQGDASVSPEDGRDAQDRRINGRLESEEETK